jgi:hypothetical protein
VGFSDHTLPSTGRIKTKDGHVRTQQSHHACATGWCWSRRGCRSGFWSLQVQRDDAFVRSLRHAQRLLPARGGDSPGTMAGVADGAFAPPPALPSPQTGLAPGTSGHCGLRSAMRRPLWIGHHHTRTTNFGSRRRSQPAVWGEPEGLNASRRGGSCSGRRRCRTITTTTRSRSRRTSTWRPARCGTRTSPGAC